MHQLFEQYGVAVLRDLTLLGVPRSDLDDARQEVFLVVWRRLPTYVENGRMRSWLYSICTRVAWSRRRSLRRRPVYFSTSPEQLVAPTQHDHVVNHEDFALGCQLLSTLPSEQREVFWLYEVEELSMPEVARRMGCPLQTAYSRLHKARERVLAAVQLAVNDETDEVG